MGMSFGFKVYDIERLKAYYERVAQKPIGPLTPSELLDEVMPNAGYITDGKFIVQNVDYWEDDNPEYEWERLMNAYFSIKWSMSHSADEALIVRRYEGFNADDFAAEELGIEELPDEED